MKAPNGFLPFSTAYAAPSRPTTGTNAACDAATGYSPGFATFAILPFCLFNHFDRKNMTRSATLAATLAVCAATLLGGCATEFEKEMAQVDAASEKVKTMQAGMSTKEKDAMADACRKDTSNRTTGRASLNSMLLAFYECELRLGK
jgi:entry exclusion lipoprotein TrbK